MNIVKTTMKHVIGKHQYRSCRYLSNTMKIQKKKQIPNLNSLFVIKEEASIHKIKEQQSLQTNSLHHKSYSMYLYPNNGTLLILVST